MPPVFSIIEEPNALSTAHFPPPLNMAPLPPMIITEKGESLHEFIQRRHPDFFTAIQVKRSIRRYRVLCLRCFCAARRKCRHQSSTVQKLGRAARLIAYGIRLIADTARASDPVSSAAMHGSPLQYLEKAVRLHPDLSPCLLRYQLLAPLTAVPDVVMFTSGVT